MDSDESPPITLQKSPVFDPYAPPSAAVAAPVYSVGEQAPLAGRGSRFAAQLLNGLTTIPGSIFFVIVFFSPVTEQADIDGVSIACIVVGIIYFIALLVINLILIARQGQSLGKKWVKIRVVRTDGSPASLGRQIGLRYIVNAIPGQVPLVGIVYVLVDILFIFRDDRRCIHDLIADTKVVVA